MRAFYCTYKQIRLFVFGVPEGWLAALYDLEKRQWIEQGGKIHGSLREAKIDVLERAAAVIGKKLPDVEWH